MNKKNTKILIAVIITMLLTVIVVSCKVTEKKSTATISTSETTEPTESAYGRIKGVVIGGESSTTEETKPTETEPTATTEETKPSETEPSETEATAPTTAAPTKAPKKKATPKKPASKKTTKKKKKKTTKKTTPAQTSSTYKYCTCDAKVNYGVSGSSHTFTGLTAQQSNGKWVLTSASTSKIVSWLNSNVKDKYGKPSWHTYSATITNTRNYRNTA